MMKRIVIFLSMLVLSARVTGQVDPHFSQFYAYPLWLNPGLTGVADGDYRFTAIYRNQWRNVTTPFSTIGFSGDVATGSHLNFGANIINQTAGDGGYKYTNAYATVAYSGLRFGADQGQQITFGIQAGWLTRRFDLSKLQFGDQWNPITGYNPGATTADLLVSGNASSVFDAGAGVSYMDNRVDQSVNFFGGAGAFHLTRPEDPFVSAGTKKVLPVRYSLHAGARVRASGNLSVTPNALYIRQGNASETMFGLVGQFSADETTEVLLGLNYRVKDAISPYVGLGYRNFLLGLTYDVNNSELGKAVRGTNSIELSLTWIGRNGRKPLRYLACPRL